jgi:ABC-2 type transport system ATP-binding protein
MTVNAQEMIRVEGISKAYPTGFWRKRVGVLFDLSFTIRRNEIVGFLGPNGAGKTTTIKILNHLAFPDSGKVSILGEDAGIHPEKRRRIGFMPEQPYFYEYLTGKEFLHLCGRLNGMGKVATALRSGEMLHRVGLEEAGTRAIRKYSKGMMQRLGLAQALLHDPELVILDEPMSGLDPMGRMEVRGIIRDLKAAGKTVFFSSHIITDVEALCDRVILLHKGRKVAEDSVNDLMGKEVRYVELILSSAPPREWLDAVGISPGAIFHQGNAFVLRADTIDEANRIAGAAAGAGLRLYSMIPVKRQLEEIYMEQVGGGGEDARG